VERHGDDDCLEQNNHIIMADNNRCDIVIKQNDLCENEIFQFFLAASFLLMFCTSSVDGMVFH
jgi:hypothetical protein